MGKLRDRMGQDLKLGGYSPANNRPPCELADILRAHGEQYCRQYSPSPAQKKVMRHILQCRTAALGGHLDQCDACGQQRISFHSCRESPKRLKLSHAFSERGMVQ